MAHFRETPHTTDPLPRGFVRLSVRVPGTWVAGITRPTTVPGFRQEEITTLFPFDSLQEAYRHAEQAATRRRARAQA